VGLYEQVQRDGRPVAAPALSRTVTGKLQKNTSTPEENAGIEERGIDGVSRPDSLSHTAILTGNSFRDCK